MKTNLTPATTGEGSRAGFGTDCFAQLRQISRCSHLVAAFVTTWLGPPIPFGAIPASGPPARLWRTLLRLRTFSHFWLKLDRTKESVVE